MNYLQENGIYARGKEGDIIPIPQADNTTASIDALRAAFVARNGLLEALSEQIRLGNDALLAELKMLSGGQEKFYAGQADVLKRLEELEKKFDKGEDGRAERFKLDRDLANAWLGEWKSQMDAILQKLKELEELRQWKKEAIAVMPDYQEIGKILGLKLGDSVHDKIIPALLKKLEYGHDPHVEAIEQKLNSLSAKKSRKKAKR